MSENIKTRVQQQFGAAAADYAASEVHARGESLGVLLELAAPQPTWRVLDVATGAGHTALTFAPRVAEVVATDLTVRMLQQTAQAAAARGLTNVRTAVGDAEAIPFPDGSFDAVTCRLAFHHFPAPDRAAAEMARVLRPGGVLGFTDNHVVEDPAADAFYNAFEKLRDPSHVRVRPVPELRSLFAAAGLTVTAERRLTKEFEFHSWADRQRVAPADKERLLEMLRTVPPALTPLLSPRFADGTAYFTLWEVVLVGRRAGPA